MISWPAALLLLTIAVAAVAMTALLRAAGLVRGAILGGAFVGLLLGATVLGRVKPDSYERLLSGGSSERLALDDLMREHGAAQTALRQTGVSQAALDELRQEQSTSEARARTALDQAQRDFRQVQVGLIIALAMALLTAAMPNARKTPRWSDAFFASLWTVLAVGCVLGGLALLVFKCTGAQAIALALTFVICGAPVGRSSRAGRQEEVVVGSAQTVHQLVSISFVVWLVCLLAGLGFLFAGVGSDSAAMLQTGTLNAALPMGVVAGAALMMIPPKWRIFLLAEVITPILAALVMLHIDVLSAWFISSAIFGLVVGGDARWLGLTTGLHWTGAPWRASFIMSIPLVDTGAIQLALAGSLGVCGFLTGPLLATAVVGAIVCDLTFFLRPRLLRAFFAQQTEEESR